MHSAHRQILLRNAQTAGESSKLSLQDNGADIVISVPDGVTDRLHEPKPAFDSLARRAVGYSRQRFA
jgi:hypothetical protein